MDENENTEQDNNEFKNLTQVELDNIRELKNALTKEKEEFSLLKDEINSEKEHYANIRDNINSILDEINSQKTDLTASNEAFIDDLNKTIGSYEAEFSGFNAATDEKFSKIEAAKDAYISEYDEQIKKILEEAKNLVSTTDTQFQAKLEEFNTLNANANTNYINQSNQLANSIAQFNTQATEANEKIKSHLDESISNNTEIKKIQSESKVFKASVDEYIENMGQTTADINKKTKAFGQFTQEIVDQNKELTKQIEEQLVKATGVSLFHTFQKRKAELEATQKKWLIGVIVCISVLICISVWIMHSLSLLDLSNTNSNWFLEFIFKFTISTPIIYLLYFVTDRYTKERRLTEEYAFKSTISLALKPYMDLIRELDGETDAQDKEFLINSVNNIFKTPTDKVFKTKEHQYSVNTSGYYDGIGKLIKESDSVKS